MQNVAERCDVVTISEIRFLQVALDEFEAIGHAESPRDAFGRRNHSGPIDRSDLHVPRILREHNSPNSRAGGKIEDAYFIFRLREFQMIGKRLRRGVTHRNDIFDQAGEEFGALALLIHGLRWPAGADDIA